jgi:hypothetical protein
MNGPIRPDGHGAKRRKTPAAESRRVHAARKPGDYAVRQKQRQAPRAILCEIERRCSVNDCKSHKKKPVETTGFQETGDNRLADRSGFQFVKK